MDTKATQTHQQVTNSACIRIPAVRLLKFTTFVLFSFPGISEVRGSRVADTVQLK